MAESSTHGVAGRVASRVLSVDFDQTGSDFIDMGTFHYALDTLDLTLGIYPIGQIALAIYTHHHAPSHSDGPDVEGEAAKLDFMVNGSFDPMTAMVACIAAYQDAKVIKFDYNIAAVIAHLARAMNLVESCQLRLRPEDGARSSVPTTWSEFVYSTVDETGHRRA